MKQLVAILLLLTSPAFAAFNAGTHWDVRTTGSDSNGGAFDATVAAPGTDFSQQNAAQQAYTDIVIGGTTTQITSAAHPFGSTSPGNFINITAGTGCTVQRVEILSVSGVTATLDKSAGTAASTCTGNLGGGMLTIATPLALMIAGNTMDIKSGTYTITSTLTTPAAANLLTFRGYQTTHSDGGTRPLITTATNSVIIWTYGAAGKFIFDNLIMSSTAGTPSFGIQEPASGSFIYMSNCKMSGFTTAITSTNTGSFFYLGGSMISNSEFTANTNGVVSVDGLTYIHNYFHGNTGDAIASSANTGESGSRVVLIGNIITGNNRGLAITNSQTFSIVAVGNTIANNTSDGIVATVVQTYYLTLQNNIIYGNGGWGVNLPATSVGVTNSNNGYGANTSGNRNNLSAGTGDVTLTASPFTNSGAGDFSLNATAGGGAALKGVGFPGAFSGGTSTGFADIGALQSQAVTSAPYGAPILQ